MTNRDVCTNVSTFFRPIFHFAHTKNTCWCVPNKYTVSKKYRRSREIKYQIHGSRIKWSQYREFSIISFKMLTISNTFRIPMNVGGMWAYTCINLKRCSYDGIFLAASASLAPSTTHSDSMIRVNVNGFLVSSCN